MRRKNSGSTLLSTLATLAVIVTLGLVMSQMSVEHLTFSSLKISRQNALDLARSAGSLAIAKLSQEPEFGTQPGTPALRVPGVTAKDEGLVMFDRQLASSADIPYSLNNFKGQAAKPSSLGSSVPQSSAHIVAVGRAAGLVRRIEIVLALPPFPFALASSGPIRANRGVQIAGLTALPPLGATISPDSANLTEADLVSNDASANAVFLGPGTDIRGSVQAVGTISLDPSAPKGSIQVRGSLRNNSENEAIPSQQIASYDPLTKGDSFSPIETALLGAGANRLGGRLRRQGSLQVQDGLFLDGCFLYVDGDLKVSGGLKGKGVVVATGQVQLQGQSQFESGAGVAILSGKDTRISGSSPSGSYFQGIIYTQGRFSADRVTLVGSLIADNEGQPSPVDLTDTRILTPPNPTVRLPLPVSGPGTPAQDPRLGPILGTFQVNIFDRETGMKGVVPIEIRQGPGGMWVQVGAAAPELVGDPSLVVDFIEQSLGPYSHQPVRAQVEPLLTGYDPAWQPAAEPLPADGAAVITVDPSSFLKLQERIRVVSYREDR